MFQSTWNNAKGNSWEHIGIVTLSRIESLSAWKSDRIERTSTGKNATSLNCHKKAKESTLVVRMLLKYFIHPLKYLPLWKLGCIYLISLLRGYWSYLTDYISRASGCWSYGSLAILCDYQLPYSGKSYQHNLEEEKVKASTRYSLCASMPEEEYMGRRYTPGAVKLKVVTMGDAAGFVPQQQIIHKNETKATKCCTFGCGNFWGAVGTGRAFCSSQSSPFRPLHPLHSSKALSQERHTTVLPIAQVGDGMSSSGTLWLPSL